MNQRFVNGMIHVIQKGENLYQLSRKYRVPLALILRANPYVDVYNLQPGQEICIPMSKPMMPFPGVRPPQQPPRPQPREEQEMERPEEELMEEREEQYEDMYGENRMFQEQEIEEADLYVADGTKSIKQIWEEMGVSAEEFAQCNDWDNVIVAADVTFHMPKKV